MPASSWRSVVVKSKLIDALRLELSPVAVLLTDVKPEGALQFKEGRWGCVGSSIVAVAKGRSAVFDRQTFGCPGGGVGLGFGDQYTQCGMAIEALLSTGDAEVAAKLQRSSKMAEGERFFQTPETVTAWLGTIPMTDVATEYVVLKPFDQVADDETPAMVVFLANADQLSALVVLADFGRGSGESAIARFGGACQSIVFGYAEAQQERPRGIIGFFDIAQRSHVSRETLSFTAPWALFLEMESHVEDSFLEMEDWKKLQERQ
jgi:uncharacterized protein (DUF169 family)